MTGIAAGVAGSALVVSMLIAAAISLFTALSIAELAAWKPVEGSVYEYTYQLVSPFAGFLVGWMWMLSNVFGGAAVSLSFAHYLKALVPALPAGAIAAILCLAFTVINVLGVRESASLNNAIVVTKLLILTFFVIFGSLHVRAAHFAPFAPFHTGVLYGACFVFFAYGGFARVAIVAEEIRDAKRTVPRAILLSLGISTLVYMLVGTVAVGLVGAAGLSGPASPLTQAMKATRSAAASSIISVGALLATASVLLTAILGVSRMAYAMAKRKDIPSALGKLGARRGTPHVSIWISGAAHGLACPACRPFEGRRYQYVRPSLLLRVRQHRRLEIEAPKKDLSSVHSHCGRGLLSCPFGLPSLRVGAGLDGRCRGGWLRGSPAAP